MEKTIVVFAPHPDDETFGCGGTVAKKIREGYKVIVIIITDGRHAFSKILNIKVNPSPEEMKHLRRNEVIEATKVLGLPVTNLVFWEIEDGTLEAQKKALEGKVCEILEKYLPVEVYFPLAGDAHPDHQATNRVVRNCIKKLKLPLVKYQYSIGFRLMRIGPRIERLLDTYKNRIVDVDISDYLDLKKEACNKFKSEISIISNEQKNPIEKNLSKYLENTERFYIDKS